MATDVIRVFIAVGMYIRLDILGPRVLMVNRRVFMFVGNQRFQRQKERTLMPDLSMAALNEYTDLKIYIYI